MHFRVTHLLFDAIPVKIIQTNFRRIWSTDETSHSQSVAHKSSLVIQIQMAVDDAEMIN